MNYITPKQIAYNGISYNALCYDYNDYGNECYYLFYIENGHIKAKVIDNKPEGVDTIESYSQVCNGVKRGHKLISNEKILYVSEMHILYSWGNRAFIALKDDYELDYSSNNMNFISEL